VTIDERVQAVIDGGEEADDILRAALAAVHESLNGPWSAIAFVEEGQMAIGPLAGSAAGDAPAPALAVPIVYRGDTVAALWLGRAPESALVAELERAAALLAPYCLVGWDTGGEEWVP
jgi:hypothetical protein